MQIAVPHTALMNLDTMYHAAVRIVSRLRCAGFQAYIVGGAVRDLCLGGTPKDYDITTDAVPAEIMRIFSHSIPVGASFGVITVVEGGMNFEVATFREERDYEDGRRPETLRFSKTPQEDVIRRDFTVNALLLDPENGVIIDHTSGYDDLRRGILRTIGDPFTRFSEDYLRMLRAVRFTVRLQLEMEKNTRDAIIALTPKLRFLSPERVRDEFTRMLCGPYPDRAVRLASELGILKELLPEAEAMRGVEQPPEFHPEGDVFEHTMLMLSHIAYPTPELGWAVLLHDIGKPLCRGVTDSGRVHFYSHEEVGAGIALEIMKRLKFPSAMQKSISGAVRNHMRFAQIHLMRSAKWRRIMAEPDFPLELELHRIDCVSCHGKMENYLLMLDRLHELEASHTPPVPEPLLTGKDILALGVPAGPRVGELLKHVADLQLEGAVSTREEALDAAEKLLRQESSAE